MIHDSASIPDFWFLLVILGADARKRGRRARGTRVFGLLDNAIPEFSLA